MVSVRNKCIRYFDSLGGTDWDKLHGVRQYLKDEAARTDQEFNTDEWTLIPCLHDVPRQLNSESYTFFHLDNTFLYYYYLSHILSTVLSRDYDCGVFVCMICDFIANDCEPVFQQFHIDECRQKIALAILRNRAIRY